MRGYRHLNFADRKEIERLYNAGHKVQDISESIGVSKSTLYNELRRGDTGTMDQNGRSGYSSAVAQREAYAASRRRRGTG